MTSLWNAGLKYPCRAIRRFRFRSTGCNVRLVSIVLVTWNSRLYLEWCRSGIQNQSHPRCEVIIVDNASGDGTKEWIGQRWHDAATIFLNRNCGFCRAVNIGIANAKGEYILLLNPDVKLEKDFIKHLHSAMESIPDAAIMTGKLLKSLGPQKPALDPPVIDSTGIYFKRNFRHFDRGSQEIDKGQYEHMEKVFGASGAAMFIRQEAVKDISIDGQFLDEDFFAYRDDADVCWRTRLLGWEIYYVPDAVAYHVRRVLSSNRRETGPVINMHSVKNRFLMRIKNLTWDVFTKTFLPASIRDLIVLCACLTVEISSLSGLVYVLKNRKRAMAKRRWIFSKLPHPRPSLSCWFSDGPVSLPIEVYKDKSGDYT